MDDTKVNRLYNKEGSDYKYLPLIRKIGPGIRGHPRTNGSVWTNCKALEWGCRPIEISGGPIETSWLCTLY